MSTQIDPANAAGGWEPVPPGHPDRASFEEHMHRLGIRPAIRWEPRRDWKVFRKPGWRQWLRALVRR